MRSSIINREIFVDTSGFYALLVRKDTEHKRAAAWIDTLRSQRRAVVTTDYVLDETATLLKSRGLIEPCRSLFTLIEDGMALRIEWTDEGRFRESKRFFLKHADHTYSFTDCVSFIVMRGLRLREALTKDGHFQEAGFDALLC